MDQVALIALGANQPSPSGSPAETVAAALRMLETEYGLRPRATSRFFRTPAFPAGAGPDYINAAAAFDCPLAAADLLDVLHAIEHAHDRRRETRWAARSLDLDLLDLGGKILPSRVTWRKWYELAPGDQAKTAPDELILPHPRLHERAFVLVPLADIASEWRHPVLDLTVMDMLSHLPPDDVASIVPL